MNQAVVRRSTIETGAVSANCRARGADPGHDKGASALASGLGDLRQGNERPHGQTSPRHRLSRITHHRPSSTAITTWGACWISVNIAPN